jgi:small conductance mechanosensitive channel
MIQGTFNFDLIKAQILAAVTQYGGKILLAIVALIIGRFLIARLTSFMNNAMDRRKVDRDVQPFLIPLLAYC